METRRCAWPAALFYSGTLEMEMDGQQNHAPPPFNSRSCPNMMEINGIPNALEQQKILPGGR